jgi:hypothetical protein
MKPMVRRYSHPLPGRRAFVGFQDEQVLAARTGRQHHALRGAEAHLARFQVGHHDGQAAGQAGRVVGRADAGEHGAGPVADVERQLEQLVGALHRLRRDDARDPQVDLREIVNRYLGRQRGDFRLRGGGCLAGRRRLQGFLRIFDHRLHLEGVDAG